MSVNSKSPLWVTIAASVLAVILTLVADRVGLASQISTVGTRVEELEKDYIEMTRAHMLILEKLDSMKDRVESNGTILQKVEDRQEEVRRRMGILDK